MSCIHESKEAGMSILKSTKADFRTKNTKERRCFLIKVSFLQQDLIICKKSKEMIAIKIRIVLTCKGEEKSYN